MSSTEAEHHNVQILVKTAVWLLTLLYRVYNSHQLQYSKTI